MKMYLISRLKIQSRASTQSKMNLKRIIDTLTSYSFKTINFRLVFYVVTLSVIGVGVVSSATDDKTVLQKQIIGLVVGVVVMIIFMLIKYEFLARYYWLMYIFSLVVLALVISPLGVSTTGAQRWIKIFGLKVQPSELSKLLLIFFFATLVAKNAQIMNSWKFILFAMILAAIPIVLILKEPDLSTSIVIIATICAIIFVSDLHKRFIKRILIVALPAIIAALVLIFTLPPDKNIINEYQYSRLVGFYDKDNEVAERIRYQQENSVLAIANGSLTGMGLRNNSITSVKNADFISEPQTDFIFTIVGEEIGFIGSFAVVTLLGLIVFECFRIGMRAREQIGKGIAVGVGSWIGFQSFINLGVVTMIIPNTGLTLPFVSAGLSSLLILFAGIGVVLNIGIHRKISF